jgi:hypothetical protein
MATSSFLSSTPLLHRLSSAQQVLSWALSALGSFSLGWAFFVFSPFWYPSTYLVVARDLLRLKGMGEDNCIDLAMR